MGAKIVCLLNERLPKGERLTPEHLAALERVLASDVDVEDGDAEAAEYRLTQVRGWRFGMAKVENPYVYEVEVALGACSPEGVIVIWIGSCEEVISDRASADSVMPGVGNMIGRAIKTNRILKGYRIMTTIHEEALGVVDKLATLAEEVPSE